LPFSLDKHYTKHEDYLAIDQYNRMVVLLCEAHKLGHLCVAARVLLESKQRYHQFVPVDDLPLVVPPKNNLNITFLHRNVLDEYGIAAIVGHYDWQMTCTIPEPVN
jgi:hypothetical protein